MKNFKKITTKAALLILLLIVFINQGKAQDSDFYVNFELDFFNFQSTAMPDYFRNIPAHKDDGGGQTGLINRSQYELLSMISLDYGNRYNYDKSAFKFGIMYGYCGQTEGRNYTNARGTNQRGYGAALTFSGISIQGPLALLGVKPLMPLFFITPKISYEYLLSKKSSYPRISIGAYYELLTAVNGWDRYDNLQCNEFKILSHVIPISLSYRTKWGKPNNNGTVNGVGVGVRYFLNFQTSYGREFGVNTFPVGVFVNIGMNEY